MKITCIKKTGNNLLVCERKTGDPERAVIGPNLPYHDIAHYVVEKTLAIRKGFFGYIYEGYSVQELSTKEVIQTLSTEVMIAEVLTRGLQSLYSGAMTHEDFSDLVSQEIQTFQPSYSNTISPEQREEMLKEYRELLEQREKLQEGGKLQLELQW